MDIDPELFARDRELAAYASQRPMSDDWMTQANRASARSLRNLVHEAWMPSRRGVIARFHDGDVAGHTAPAYQILRAAYEFNDAVVAVANRMLDNPHTVITDAVRKRLGLLIRPLMTGSVQIDLVCPIPGIDESMELPQEAPGQTVIPDLQDLSSRSDQALQHVLEVLRQITHASTQSEIAKHTLSIGPDGWLKLARLAGRCIDGDFTIDFSSRIEPSDRFSFAPSHALALKAFIKERSLTTTEVPYTGIWQTASSVRSWFDLQTDSNKRISGSVPTELTEVSIQLLNQRVRALIREETDQEQEGHTVKRTVVSLEAIPQSA
ncbi:hypothetical protein ACL02S_09955 [Nocardia sp. 004]|uniref:hypothetical protein n=1 Tax=Nocardia sp. 004 TaxID=3385978 RepID=UPI0039A359EF